MCLGRWQLGDGLVFITEIQNQPGNSKVRTVIRSGRITVRVHDELQSAVICELQSALRGAARRPALPGTESPAVPVWDLLGPPALPSATPTASAVRTCPRRNPGGVRPSLAPTGPPSAVTEVGCQWPSAAPAPGHGASSVATGLGISTQKWAPGKLESGNPGMGRPESSIDEHTIAVASTSH